MRDEIERLTSSASRNVVRIPPGLIEYDPHDQSMDGF